MNGYILGTVFTIFAAFLIPNAANGAKIRVRRNVAVEVLPDKDRCVHHCWTTFAASNSTTTYNTKKMEHKIRNNQIDSQKRVARQTANGETFSGTGALFDIDCQNVKKLNDCLNACPDSKLKRLATAESIQSQSHCFSQNGHYVAFANYYYKLECVSNAMSNNASRQCGSNKSIANVTFLLLTHNNEEQDKGIIYYEEDKEKNTAECRRVCEKQNKQYSCYKPILISECDQDGYDLYTRITKVQARSHLAMLKELDAVDSDIPECHNFYS